MQNPRYAKRQLVVIGLCVGLAGCAATTRQMTGGAVEGTVSTVAEPENLARIDSITASPEFQRSIERVGESMARGISSGISSGADFDVDVDEVARSTEEIGRSLGRGLARGFVEGLEGLPEPGQLLDDAISGALASASSDLNQERARDVISNATGTVVRSAMASAAEGLEQDIDPSLDRALDRVSSTAAPRLARLLSDQEFRSALGGMFREVSRNATLGFDSGMEQVRASNRAAQEGILGRGWVISLLGAAFVLLAGAIVAIIVLVAANSRRRREREEMLTSMLVAFAGHGTGIDEATRAELLRSLGVTTHWFPPKPPPPTPGVAPREGVGMGESRGPVTAGPATASAGSSGLP